jgi:uncharacterized membrane protein YkvA (DUF1232 family)
MVIATLGTAVPLSNGQIAILAALLALVVYKNRDLLVMFVAWVLALLIHIYVLTPLGLVPRFLAEAGWPRDMRSALLPFAAMAFAVIYYRRK